MRLSDCAALFLALVCISVAMDIHIYLEAGKSFGLSGRELQEYVESHESEAREREVRDKKVKDAETRDERAHQLEIRRQDKQILDLKLMIQKATMEEKKLVQRSLMSEKVQVLVLEIKLKHQSCLPSLKIRMT